MTNSTKNFDTVGEFKAIFINIIPTDELTRIKICDAIEKFMYENPEEYQKVVEEVHRKFMETVDVEFMEAFEG